MAFAISLLMIIYNYDSIIIHDDTAIPSYNKHLLDNILMFSNNQWYFLF